MTATGFWAGVDPAIQTTRGDAHLWRLFIHLRTEPSEQAVTVEKIDVITIAPGFEGLDGIDDALIDSGYRRSGAWEEGTGRGFVCRIDIEPLNM
jgi:hypothetical protein